MLRPVASLVALLALAVLWWGPTRAVRVDPGHAVVATTDAALGRARAIADSLGARVAPRESLPFLHGTVHVVGAGLDDATLAALRGRVVPHLDTAGPGVLELAVPRTVLLGATVAIAGRTAAAGESIVLVAPDGVSDTVTADSAGRFRVSVTPRTVGLARYVLQAIATDTLALHVRDADSLDVLVLLAAPSFEASRLRDWLARRGARVAERVVVSRGRTRTTFINRDRAPVAVDARTLSGTDVIVADAATLATLGGEARSALLRAVADSGRGLVVLPDARLGAVDGFVGGMTAARAGREGRITFDDGGAATRGAVMLAPWTPAASPVRALVAATAGGTIPAATWEPLGTGRIATSLVAAPSRWLLEGEADAFARYWALLVDAVRPLAPRAELATPAPSLVHEPVAVLSPIDTARHAVIEPPDGAPPDTVPVVAGRAAFWPRSAGVHRILVGGDTVPVLVQGSGAWQTLRRERAATRTLRVALDGTPTSASQPARTERRPLPRWPFFLLLLVATTLAWRFPADGEEGRTDAQARRPFPRDM